jgi:hypothetical protein
MPNSIKRKRDNVKRGKMPVRRIIKKRVEIETENGRLSAVFAAGSHRRNEKTRVDEGEGCAGQGNHPKLLAYATQSGNQMSTYIPSKTRNSFSFCISGLPQPPAISGILYQES